MFNSSVSFPVSNESYSSYQVCPMFILDALHEVTTRWARSGDFTEGYYQVVLPQVTTRCRQSGDHKVALARSFIIVSLSSASQVPGGQCPVVDSASQWEEVLEAMPPVLLLGWRRPPVLEVQVQPADRVHDGHCLHPGQALGGQAPLAGGDHLHRQSLQDELCQLAAHAAPHTAAERHIAESGRAAFLPLCGKAIWVKELRLLEDRRCLMGVPDAIHDAPAFGDLVALQGKSSSLDSSIGINSSTANLQFRHLVFFFNFLCLSPVKIDLKVGLGL